MTPPGPSEQPAHPSGRDTGQTETLPAGLPAALDSANLLRGGRSVEIRHNGEVYRLQATRLGKLILTK